MPLINLTVAYYATVLGMVGKFYILAPWTTPAVIAAFLSTMDWKAPVLWILLFAFDTVVWIIFMKGYDKLLLKQENKSAE